MKELLRLQLFAEDGQDGQDPQNNNNPDGGEGSKNSQELKYTDDDVNKIINQKFAEWEKKQQKKVDEAKKLAEMNATQKAEYERDELQKRIDEYEKKETRSNMSKEARKILSGEGISVTDELLNVLVSDDAETTNNAVKSFADMFNKAVSEAVKKQLGNNKPPKTGGASGLTKEDILKVQNRAERQRLIRENMDLFR